MYNYIIIFILSILIFIYIAYLFNTNINLDYIKDDIYYLSYKETSNFLLNDSDNYVSNMNDADLYARKVKSKKEYLENISNNTISFNEEEKNKLYKCTKIADKFLLNYKKKFDDNIILNGIEIANIKWKLALVNKPNRTYNIEYEEGMPHTRNDIIFLSKYVLNNDDDNLINILIHEKVHIYQRYNYEKIEKIINKMGYVFSRKTKNIKLLRANPDLNDNIYYDNKNNIELIGIYKNNTPNGINDIIIKNFAAEHPYEKMAYDIAEEYTKQVMNKYKNDNQL